MPIDEPNDIRRRVERIEQNQSEMQSLLRETALIHAKLNETLSDMKDEFKSLKIDMKQIRDLEVEISNLKLGFAAIKWISGSLFGTITLIILSYLFKIQIGLAP